jgi:DNA-binding beta-propeller fold protein YncE
MLRLRVPPTPAALLVLAAFAPPAAAQTPTPPFERTFGSQGPGSGEFVHPRGITCDAEGNVYVTDTRSGVGLPRIHKFDNHGTFLMAWELTGSEEMNDPEDAAVSPDGHLFVVEGSSRIHKFTLTGGHVLSFGSCCSGLPGRLWVPMGIDVDEAGLVYVADGGNGRIAVFDGSGGFVRGWKGGPSEAGTLHQPMAVASDDQGTILVLDFEPNSQQRWIKAYTSTGDYLWGWGAGWPEAPIVDGGLDYGAQRFVVTGWGDSKLRMTNILGVELAEEFGGAGLGEGGFQQIVGIAIDPEGNLFVLDGALDRVTKFSAVTVPARPVTWGRLKGNYR